jgi:hypothetical protein
VATSEPVVRHHARQGGGAGGNEVRPSVFNGLLGGVVCQPFKKVRMGSVCTRTQMRGADDAVQLISPRRSWMNVSPVRRKTSAGTSTVK